MASYDLDKSGGRSEKNSDMFQMLSLLVSKHIGKCSRQHCYADINSGGFHAFTAVF